MHKKDYPTKLFVIVSLDAFALAAFLFFVFGYVYNFGSGRGRTEHMEAPRYYFDLVEPNSDPLITGNRSFEDALSGPIISGLDPNLGSNDAPVSIVVFSDFGCDYCHRQESVFKELIAKYPEKVNFIWKDFPPTDMNSYEWQAAHAARCAEEQGMFWQYHDELYNIAEDERERVDFVSLAKKIGLREKTFTECMADLEIDGLINDNVVEASILDIPGIPFIYINNQEVFGEAGFEELDAIIQDQLKEE